jgi:hypothetical protein
MWTSITILFEHELGRYLSIDAIALVLDFEVKGQAESNIIYIAEIPSVAIMAGRSPSRSERVAWILKHSRPQLLTYFLLPQS